VRCGCDVGALALSRAILQEESKYGINKDLRSLDRCPKTIIINSNQIQSTLITSSLGLIREEKRE